MKKKTEDKWEERRRMILGAFAIGAFLFSVCEAYLSVEHMTRNNNIDIKSVTAEVNNLINDQHKMDLRLKRLETLQERGIHAV